MPSRHRFTEVLLFLAAFSLSLGAQEPDVPVLHAADHGVQPDTDQDCAPALQAALDAAARRDGPLVVQLERGVHRLVPRDADAPILALRGGRGVTLRGRGEGTVLLVTGPCGGCLLLEGCEACSVEELSVDYAPVPFSQGTVFQVSADKGWVDVAVAEGFPEPDHAWFAGASRPGDRWGLLFERDRPRLKAGAPGVFYVEAWTRLSGRVWRVRPANARRGGLHWAAMGDRVVFVPRRAGAAVQVTRGGECAVRRVVVRASQGAAVAGTATGGMVVDRVTVAPAPGSGRLLSANSDGAHFQQNTLGPLVAGCHFEAVGDDGVNVHFPAQRVSGVLSPVSFRLEGGGEIWPGDVLLFVDTARGAARGWGRTETVRGDARNGLRVALDRPVTGSVAGSSWRTADTVVNVSRCGGGYVFRDNIFRRVRGHGMVVDAPNGLVQNNFFDECGGMGIVSGADSPTPQGGYPSNVVVRRNTVRDCGRAPETGISPRGAAVHLGAVCARGVAGGRLVENVAVEDLYCVNPPGAALWLGGVRGAEVTRLRAAYAPGFVPPRATAAMAAENVSGLHVDDCSVAARQPEVTAALRLGPDVEGAAIGRLQADTAPGSPLVEEVRGAGTE